MACEIFFIYGSKYHMPLQNPTVNSYMGKAILLFADIGGAILLFAGTGGAILIFAVFIDHPPGHIARKPTKIYEGTSLGLRHSNGADQGKTCILQMHLLMIPSFCWNCLSIQSTTPLECSPDRTKELNRIASIIKNIDVNEKKKNDLYHSHIDGTAINAEFWLCKCLFILIPSRPTPTVRMAVPLSCPHRCSASI
jgi:hypothetical protein